MFTVDALNQLTATHAAALGRPVDGNTPAVFLPDGYMVHSTEHLQELRSRFRGAMSTQSLPDFCNYVERRSESATMEFGKASGFIDADQMSCLVFFNLGDMTTPGHADDTAALELKPTAAYAAMRRIAGERLSQTQLAEWMEDWADHLAVVGTQGESIPVGIAVQKIRTITVKATAEVTNSEGSFSQGRSAMDQIEAAHAEQQPADLIFKAEPYEGLQTQTFTLRLSVITGEKPVLIPRWVRQGKQEEEIAQDFKGALTAHIGEHANLTLGRFKPGN